MGVGAGVGIGGMVRTALCCAAPTGRCGICGVILWDGCPVVKLRTGAAPTDWRADALLAM